MPEPLLIGYMPRVGDGRDSLLLLFLLTRGLSRRTLGDLSPFEMILLITIGDVVQQGVTLGRRDEIRRPGPVGR